MDCKIIIVEGEEKDILVECMHNILVPVLGQPSEKESKAIVIPKISWNH
jgi:hypothetical protein